MPRRGENILEFTGTHMQHPKPFIIFPDFESLVVPISTATPSSQLPFTKTTAHHIPCGYSMLVVGPDGKSMKPPLTYRGQNAVSHFLSTLFKEKNILKKKLLHAKPLQLTPEEQKSFEEALNCHICSRIMNPDEKRRDHCHVTGKYRGAAHNRCNLNFKLSKKIPVVFHNLKNYDAHLIMQEIGKFKEYNVSIIPLTMEKYVSFSIKKEGCSIELTFLDSLQFLSASLDTLAKNMCESDFTLLKDNMNIKLPLSMLTRKGVYPYSYVSSFDVFNETHLPTKEKFKNDLTGEDITNEDYDHAQSVWKLSGFKNFGQYHDFYVQLDVLLLADIFQNFRRLCLKYYDIDPTHVFTTAGLSWQACMKMTNIQLELLTDIDMLLFIEKGVRGGVCQISERYSKANQPQTPDYKSDEPKSYITYLDANNLYGWAMSQHLPCVEFEWMDTNQITEEDLTAHSDTDDYGYIIEATLEYPQNLHDLHNDYPLAPERLLIQEEMLSEYTKSMLGGRNYTTTPKLILTLDEKKNYVLHYRNLKLYLQLGMKVSTIHKILRFRQSPWLKEYIEFNTEKRKMANSEFEKSFFKLLNNSIYGKTIENLRRRRVIELVNHNVRAEKLVASSAFKHFKIFSNDLVAVERIKQSILMNRPICVGFTILELSKLLMYRFHYKHIKEQYWNKAKLLFTDTDSLCYNITTDDLYEDFKQNANLYDFSDYPTSHPLFSNKNKKVVGKFKDEVNGKAIYEFVGLKPKMYSLQTEEGEKKRAKGVSTHVVRKKLTHQDYKKALIHIKNKNYAKQTRILQTDHQIYTAQINKISLNSFDDKRYILEDGITSLAYGHYRIKKEKETLDI